MLDSAQVKERLTTDDIVKICCSLQEDDTVFYDSQEHPIFNTCLDHEGGDSWKLFYYPETKLFHCFTGDGETYDIFELIKRFKNVDFRTAFQFVVDFFGLKTQGFEDREATELTDDWDIFQRIQDFAQKETATRTEDAIHENLLEYFYPLAAPLEWQREGISPAVMRTYGIRVDSALHKIIIPHRDAEGHLIGIRGRSFNPFDVDGGKKYMPVMIENDIYRHSLGKNLYGLFENKDTIRKIKKAFVVEAEKSVLQLATMYGISNCFAVATCGNSFSSEQMDLLLKLGVEEIILGYDRDFLGGKGAPDTMEYEAKLLKIVSPLLPYANVSVVMDYEHLTQHKDSPTDRGREIFEKLYHQRIKLYTYNEKIGGGRKK